MGVGWRRTPGAQADPPGLHPPELKASIHPLLPGLRDVYPPHPCSQWPALHPHTHPRNTHMSTRALAHASLRAAPPTCRAAAGRAGLRDAGAAPALDRRTGPGQPPPAPAAAWLGPAWGGGSSWDSPAAARPAPPRGLRPFGDRGVVSSGAGGQGGCACELAPRCGASTQGSGCRAHPEE